MEPPDLDALLADWLRIIESLGELAYDSSFEWRGETDRSVARYLDDKRDLQKEAEDALVRALSMPGVDRDRLLARAREICGERQAEEHWGTDRCFSSIRNAEYRPLEVDGKKEAAQQDSAHREPPAAPKAGPTTVAPEGPQDLPDPVDSPGAGPQSDEPGPPPTPEPAATPSQGPYKVMIDDNFHYGDRDGGYFLARFPDCESALEACKKVLNNFLDQAMTDGKTEEEVWEQYTQFGLDPYIVVKDGAPECPFSAWDYARQRIRERVGGSHR